jgi:hypothetical protein
MPSGQVMVPGAKVRWDYEGFKFPRLRSIRSLIKIKLSAMRMRYLDSPRTKEIIMAKQTESAYCIDRNVNVDLKQEFHKCIADNQCFSDNPCPLNGKFRPMLRKARQNRVGKVAPAASRC